MINKIPKKLWIFWDQGWDNAPPLIKKCRDSWIGKNPDWEVIALDALSVPEYVDIGKYSFLKEKYIQAYSDILRINLLKEHGGVWIDATVYCGKPLNDWLPSLLSGGFFAFSNPEKDILVSCWFLAAEKNSAIVKTWAKLTAGYWDNRANPDAYFWFHYLFEKAIRSSLNWSQCPHVSSYSCNAVQDIFTIKTKKGKKINYTSYLFGPPTILSKVLEARTIPVHKLHYKKNKQSMPVQIIDIIEQPYKYKSKIKRILLIGKIFLYESWKRFANKLSVLFVKLKNRLKNAVYRRPSHISTRKIPFMKRAYVYCKCKSLLPLEVFFHKKNKNQTFVKIIMGLSQVSMTERYNGISSFGRFCKKDLSWNKLVLTDKIFADYYVIIGHPYRTLEYYNPAKTIIFQDEPESTRILWKDFYKPDKKKYFYVYDIENHRSFSKWCLNKDYLWLKNNKIEKTKQFSTVMSNEYRLRGQMLRLDFVELLDKEVDIDIYGKMKKHGKRIEFLNYKGALHQKDEGLFPYKYTFTAENAKEKGYLTEKIIDAILAECLCFYWGCPNIEDFLDPKAYIKIDIEEPDKAIEIIKNALKNNEWEKRFSYIKKEKQKILDEIQFMPTIERIIGQACGLPQKSAHGLSL